MEHHLHLSLEQSSLHASLTSTGAHDATASYDSVLRQADASRKELGYKDIMMVGCWCLPVHSNMQLTTMQALIVIAPVDAGYDG